MSDQTNAAYERGVTHGWAHANYADAYGDDEPRVEAAFRRAKALYPGQAQTRAPWPSSAAALQGAYGSGFARGCERFDAGQYADGQPRDREPQYDI